MLKKTILIATLALIAGPQARADVLPTERETVASILKLFMDGCKLKWTPEGQAAYEGYRAFREKLSAADKVIVDNALIVKAHSIASDATQRNLTKDQTCEGLVTGQASLIARDDAAPSQATAVVEEGAIEDFKANVKMSSSFMSGSLYTECHYVSSIEATCYVPINRQGSAITSVHKLVSIGREKSMTGDRFTKDPVCANVSDPLGRLSAYDLKFARRDIHLDPDKIFTTVECVYTAYGKAG